MQDELWLKRKRNSLSGLLLRFFILTTLSKNAFTQDDQGGCYGEGNSKLVDVRNISKQTDVFAMKFLKSYINTTHGNFVISPFSLWRLLNLLQVGAGDLSYKELQHVTGSTDKNVAYYGSSFLKDRLESRSVGMSSYTLLDRIYFSGEFAALNPCPRISNFEQVDFSKLPQLTGRISIEMALKTGTRVMPFKPRDLGAAHQSIIVPDAAYFKGAWKTKFDPRKTQKRFFYNLKGAVMSSVTMMSTSGQFKYADAIYAQLVELPYRSDASTSLILIVPMFNHSFNSNVVIQMITEGALDSFLKQMKTTRVEITMPKGKILHKTTDIKTTMQRMGLNIIFHTKANFTRFSSNDNVHVSRILQATDFEVNEEGTGEFASTDSASNNRFNGFQTATKLTADRPFIFLIRNMKEGVTLMAGVFRGPISDSSPIREETAVTEKLPPPVATPPRPVVTPPPPVVTPEVRPEVTPTPTFNPVPKCGRRFGSQTFFQPGTVAILSEASIFEDKIFGGEESIKNSWPWMALLGKFEDGQQSWKCGGALINDQWVLTAAHCLLVNLQIVRLGEHNTGESDSTEQDFLIQSYLWYPGYQASHKHHDIGLVKLRIPSGNSLPFTPVCLPWREDFKKDHTGQQVIVAGWGAVSYTGRNSNVLREAKIEVFDINRCVAAYSEYSMEFLRSWPNGMKKDTSICAGHRLAEADSCQGDSGGPMVVGDHEKFTVLGVVSTGIGCGHKDYPGIYIPVYYQPYLDWIKGIAFT